MVNSLFLAPTPSIVRGPSFFHARMIKHVSLHHFEDFYEKERLTLLKNTTLLAPGASFHRFSPRSPRALERYHWKDEKH